MVERKSGMKKRSVAGEGNKGSFGHRFIFPRSLLGDETGEKTASRGRQPHELRAGRWDSSTDGLKKGRIFLIAAKYGCCCYISFFFWRGGSVFHRYFCPHIWISFKDNSLSKSRSYLTDNPVLFCFLSERWNLFYRYSLLKYVQFISLTFPFQSVKFISDNTFKKYIIYFKDDRILKVEFLSQIIHLSKVEFISQKLYS